MRSMVIGASLIVASLILVYTGAQGLNKYLTTWRCVEAYSNQQKNVRIYAKKSIYSASKDQPDNPMKEGMEEAMGEDTKEVIAQGPNGKLIDHIAGLYGVSARTCKNFER